MISCQPVSHLWFLFSCTIPTIISLWVTINMTDPAYPDCDSYFVDISHCTFMRPTNRGSSRLAGRAFECPFSKSLWEFFPSTLYKCAHAIDYVDCGDSLIWYHRLMADDLKTDIFSGEPSTSPARPMLQRPETRSRLYQTVSWNRFISAVQDS